jgi:hypothetical protein
MADNTFGSASAAPAQPAPKGAFGATNGGVHALRDGSPAGGNPPDTQRGPLDVEEAGHGVQAYGDGSPDGGTFPDTQPSQIECTPAGQGGVHRFTVNRAPESGDGQGS